MARRKTRFPSLSPDQAHASLRWLHATGAVTAKQIDDALHHRERLMAEIRARRVFLREAGG